MVYQIYYKNNNGNHDILFDIEMFLTEVEKGKWTVEMRCLRFISNSIDFILNLDDEIEEFKKDCAKMEELRGWLWEEHDNHRRAFEEAVKDKNKWCKDLKDIITPFAEKYGLFINED